MRPKTIQPVQQGRKAHPLQWVGFTAVLWCALAAAAAEKPTTATPLETCADCHADVKKFDVLHGPVNVNACDACHTLTEAATHTFKLVRQPNQLCTFCHVVDTEGMNVVHKPLQTGECLSCHNPHGGFDRGFLKGRTMGEFCSACHDNVTHEKKFAHGPVAAGACATCHQPHASKNAKLLIATGRDLCLSCHQELSKQMTDVKFKHQAVVEGDCMSCHDPHASNFRMMIKKAPAELCADCHQDVQKAVTDAPYKHAAVTQDAGCANCHNAHGSDLAGLLITEPAKMCMSCHTEPIEAADGRRVASVNDILDPRLVKHGPVADGTCGGCHNVHGSDVAKLLAKAYPATFYSAFDMQKYELCFSCHDPSIVEQPKAGGLTNFRNGDVNLHYLHVNKDKNGRTCRACHSVHASPNPVHIRDSVPYGNWELPIGFKPTVAGGSCSPGCHQPLSYDRDNPIAMPAKEQQP